jgi:hypothetical protein
MYLNYICFKYRNYAILMKNYLVRIANGLLPKISAFKLRFDNLIFLSKTILLLFS